MNSFMLFKTNAEEKDREIDDLVESIKLCKTQISTKLSEKEKGIL